MDTEDRGGEESAPQTPSALIIIPTYNEVENIASLVTGIRRATVGMGDFEILVVDDGSPDGTAEAVEQMMGSNPRLSLLNRGQKLGLGSAYRAGFDHAQRGGHAFAFTMDADHSHSPTHLPEMWALAPKADVVIGSRYVPGGGVFNWPWHRKFLSATANFMARLILGLRSHDCTSGYRCYRLDLLQRIDLDRIRSSGYSYLSEVLFRCQQAGAHIRETPIRFVDRGRGKSKISKSEIWKAMVTLLRLRFTRG